MHISVNKPYNHPEIKDYKPHVVGDQILDHVNNCPVCSGNPEKYYNKLIPDSVRFQLSENEFSQVRQLYDPLEWAKKNLYLTEGGFEARVSPTGYEYQGAMIRCTHKRIATRAGRRIGKTNAIIVRILHKAFTNKNFRVVIFTPFTSQLETIWKMFEEALRGNSALENEIKRSVKTPVRRMELFSGSSITGFVGGSGAVRSAAADLLYLDEASFLEPDDTDAVVALLAESESTELIVTSTPKGLKDWFYEKTQDPYYVRFHYPSDIMHPHWNEDMEREFKTTLTAAGYKHEIMAMISDDGEGVYQNLFVEEALTDYNYSIRPEKGWTYIIGVDWNHEGIGTQIAIIGHNPDKQKPFRIVNKETIDIEGWTQLTSVQRLVELNSIWNPKFMYVDKGFGFTAIELLHDYGHKAAFNTATKRLKKIVKGIYFSEKIEVYDPWSQIKEKKPVKPFMVNSSVKLFEDEMIEINVNDELTTKQFENYIIERYTPAGSPVYGQADTRVGDHMLDAINVAILGFILEGTGFGKQSNAKTIIPINKTLRHVAAAKEDGFVGTVVVEPPNMAATKRKEQEEVAASQNRITGINRNNPHAIVQRRTIPSRSMSLNLPRRKRF